jgi:hypothetical protein
MVDDGVSAGVGIRDRVMDDEVIELDPSLNEIISIYKTNMNQVLTYISKI